MRQILAVLLLALCSPLARAELVVVTLAPEGEAVARELALSLTRQGLAARFDPTRAAATEAAASTDLEAANAALAEAQRLYERVDPLKAIAALAGVERRARPWLDAPEAVRLLAEALRLRGLTELFLRNVSGADKSFRAAYILASDFAPTAEAWPPEARLAYADVQAATRQHPPGSLSIEVIPATATIWLDGRYVGVGAVTVRDLAAGDHQLLAVHAGYVRYAATVSVHGEGRLEHALVYLERSREPVAEALSILAGALSGPREGLLVRQLQTLLGSEGLLVLDRAPPSSELVLHCFDAQGARCEPPRIPPESAAVRAALRPSGRPLTTPPSPPSMQPEAILPVPPVPAPWYGRWYLWAGAGAVLLGSAAIYWGLARDAPRVDLYLGRRP